MEIPRVVVREDVILIPEYPPRPIRANWRWIVTGDIAKKGDVISFVPILEEGEDHLHGFDGVKRAQGMGKMLAGRYFLEYLLKNSREIPEELKGREIVFIDSLYSDSELNISAPGRASTLRVNPDTGWWRQDQFCLCCAFHANNLIPVVERP
jgi:hypothetical protein